MKAKRATAAAALYLRLSRDDEGAAESASISTQRKMLRAYCEEHGYAVAGEYIDDGWSGTSFDRPGFQRLLSDIETGAINMVLTKDLSRLGRDYITSGEITERYFPEHGVRYIAINDGYDSENQWNDLAPFRHVLNEMYARDASKKIRSALLTKMREGDYIGSFAPYGYQKDPLDKSRLAVDEEAAPVVRELFERARAGERPCDLARSLNERRVPTPLQHRFALHPHLTDTGDAHGEWTSGSIRGILGNMVYLGHMVQGKTTRVSFKSKVTLTKEREDWQIVRDTHQPLVDQETFDLVGKRTVSRRAPPKSGFHNVFSGIAKCADCGRNMSTTGTRKSDFPCNLVCGGYKLSGKKACSNHFIDYETLCDVLKREIQRESRLSTEDKRDAFAETERDTPLPPPDVPELTPALLCALVDKIEVGQARAGETPGQGKTQRIRIHFRFCASTGEALHK